MQTQLQQIAAQIRDYQSGRGLSDNELCRRYAGLGSTKTYTLCLRGETAELDEERWTLEYQAVLNLIEIERQNFDDACPPYDDLKHMTLSRLAVTDAMQEKGNNRLVIIEGQPGTGKTTAGRYIAARFGRKVVWAEVDECWKDSLSAMTGGLLIALNQPDIPVGADARKRKLIDLLKQTPCCLVLDEAHHLGPRTLNLVKSLINQTECQFVWLAIPPLLRRLESNAYEEARQLTRNRLCERVKLSSPDQSDTEKFITRRLNLSADAAKPMAKTLCERAQNYGNWNFVDLVCRKAKRLAGKDAIDQETFARALTQATTSR